MRTIVAAASTFFLLGGAALAADMPLRQAPPPIAPLATWTGFYIGVNGGGAFGEANSDFNVAGGPTFASVDLSMKGAIGGGQAGYNWQTGPAVFGVEAD